MISSNKLLLRNYDDDLSILWMNKIQKFLCMYISQIRLVKLLFDHLGNLIVKHMKKGENKGVERVLSGGGYHPKRKPQ
jgi:hypothetical protein